MSTLKATTSRFARIFVLLVASMALFAAVGCSSAPKTLEEYYKAHPEQLEAEVADFQSALSGDDFAGSSVEVTGNEIIMIGKLNLDWTELDPATQEVLLSTIDEYMKSSGNVAQMVEGIKNTESSTGISGIELTIGYTDVNDVEIMSTSYDASGVVAK